MRSAATDFIIRLSKTKNEYSAIMTFVDRFTKSAHFTPSKRHG